jgi:N-acetylmuramoyl-L-alanine amidase
MLADILVADGRFEVCLSRPEESSVLGSDTLSSLKTRVDGAAEFKADYFISLHINSYTQESVSGIEVFAGVDEKKESYSFGNSLLEGMVESTNLKNRGMKPSSELYVLENTTMPAVLLEMGFISNSGDAALLSDSPELFAQGIYKGILNHFEYAYISDINVMLLTVGISAVFLIVLIIAVFVIKKEKI